MNTNWKSWQSDKNPAEESTYNTLPLQCIYGSYIAESMTDRTWKLML